MRIKCCHGCVPPERTPYCHATCQKYINEKAALDAHNAAMRKKACGSDAAKQTIIEGCLKWRKRRNRR